MKRSKTLNMPLTQAAIRDISQLIRENVARCTDPTLRESFELDSALVSHRLSLLCMRTARMVQYVSVRHVAAMEASELLSIATAAAHMLVLRLYEQPTTVNESVLMSAQLRGMTGMTNGQIARIAMERENGVDPESMTRAEQCTHAAKIVGMVARLNKLDAARLAKVEAALKEVEECQQ